MTVHAAALTTRSGCAYILFLTLLCSGVLVDALMTAPALDWGGRGAVGTRNLGLRSTVSMGLPLPFELPFGMSQRQPFLEKKKAAKRLSGELFDMLTEEDAQPDDAVVMAKIEELEGAPGVVFNTDNLFDGRPWRVLWKTNTAWQRFFDPSNDLADNRAYQKYEKDGSVTNIAQAFGHKLYVTVDGQGAPVSASTKLPYEVKVEVSRGWLHAFGVKVPLDFIKGTGTTIVVYSDARLRVFRSDTGGVVVQTKAQEVVPT
ncbi:unnamed protein product [Ascophyllum nodosum]